VKLTTQEPQQVDETELSCTRIGECPVVLSSIHPFGTWWHLPVSDMKAQRVIVSYIILTHLWSWNEGSRNLILSARGFLGVESKWPDQHGTMHAGMPVAFEFDQGCKVMCMHACSWARHIYWSLVKQMTCSPLGETDRYLKAASVYLFFLLIEGRIVSLLTEDEGMLVRSTRKTATARPYHSLFCPNNVS